MTKYETAFNQVLPLLKYIAQWESNKGSSALLMESEYEEFLLGYQKAMIESSPRGALSSLGIKYA